MATTGEKQAFARGVIVALTTMHHQQNNPTECMDVLREFGFAKRVPRGLELSEFDQKHLALIRKWG